MKKKSSPSNGMEEESGPLVLDVDHNRPMRIEWVDVAPLVQDPRDARRLRSADEERAIGIVARLGNDTPPILLGADAVVMAGWPIVAAARKLGLQRLRAIRMEGHSRSRQLMISTAVNRLWELGDWNEEALGRLILEFEADIPEFEPIDIGWSTTEADLLIGADRIDSAADAVPEIDPLAVSAAGDIFLLDRHRVGCLDATLPDSCPRLMDGKSADMVSADPPYGIGINGGVSTTGKHREFVEGSGDKSDAELARFFEAFLAGCHSALHPGGLAYLYMDWRSQRLLQEAAEPLFGKLLNLCIWVKDRAGMGSFYRSRHELVFLYRKPGGKHRNNVQLGRHGRDRSNVWDYPCAMSTRSGREGDMLARHPTPKNVAMVMDSILDCTARGGTVLDPFLGSGTTLIACERIGRVCHGMDLDPLYVDLAIRRWQAWTGRQAVHAQTGQTFDALACERRAGETDHG